MRPVPWSRYSDVRWDHVDWLFRHPEHIDRRSPSREESIALKKVLAGDRVALVAGDWPTAPPPLCHFDKPKHHRRPSDHFDPDHHWLKFEIAARFAGFRNPPNVEQMRRFLLADKLDQYPHSALYNLFSCMDPSGVHLLRVGENLTIHEFVRALHHSGVWRECLVRRIEPMADPPLRPRYLDAYEAANRPS